MLNIRSKNKIFSMAVVLIMLSVTFSVGVGGFLGADQHGTGYVSAEETGGTEYAVTYSLGGATGVAAPTESNKEAGATFAAADMPSGAVPPNTGYLFAGWATTSSGGVAYEKGDMITMPSKNLTLYAVWVRSVPNEASFDDWLECYCDVGGATVTASGIGVTYYAPWFCYWSPAKTKVTLTVTIPVGYEFARWETVASSVGTPAAGITFSNPQSSTTTFVMPSGTDVAVKAVLELKSPYNISINPSTNKIFNEATEGYGAQTVHSVTVNNTGDQPTGALTIMLSGPNAGSFTLSAASMTNIAVGSNSTFTVVPNNGLSTGTYAATVTVSGNNITSKTFNVSFTVNAAPIKTISVGSQNGTITAGEVGNVTFTVTTGNIADNSYNATVDNLPTGVSVSSQVTINSNVGTLTLAGNASTVAGKTPTLTLSFDGVTSSAFALTVLTAGGLGGTCTVTGVIEIGTDEKNFSDLKVVLRDNETRKNYTTYVNAQGEYSFDDIPLINGEYGLYVFGGNNVMFQIVDLSDVVGNVLEMAPILLDVIGSPLSSTITVPLISSGQFNGIFTLYPSHNTAVLTSTSFTLGYAGDCVIPEIIEYQGKKYAVTGITTNGFAAANTLSSLSIPFGVTNVSFALDGSFSTYQTIYIPSSVISINMAMFGIPGVYGNNTISNVIFEEGSPFFIDSEGNICGGNIPLMWTLSKIPAWPSPAPVPVSDIVANSDALLTIMEGEGVMLKASVNSDAYNQTLYWESSNKSVATVVGGWVRALAPGTATITVTPGGDASSTVNYVEFTIIVTEMMKIYPETIILDHSSAELNTLGQNITLNASFTPSDVTEKTTIWSSDDVNVATVSKGLVTATGYGTTTVRATTTNDLGDKIYAECTIVVKDVYIGNTYSVTGKVVLMNMSVTHEDLTAVLRTEFGYPVQTATIDEIDGYVFYDVQPGDYYISIFGTPSSGFAPILVIDRNVNGGTITINGSLNNSYTQTDPAYPFYSFSFTTFGAAGLNATSQNTSGAVTLPWKVYIPYLGKECGVDRISVGNTNVTELTVPYGVTEIISLGPNAGNSNTYNINSQLTKLVLSSTVQSLPSMLPKNLSEVILQEGSPFHIDQEGWICRGTERIVKIPAFVGNPPILVNGIEFKDGVYSGAKYVGEVFTIEVIIDPADAWNQSVAWTSSNASVASVSPSGRVIALKAGNVTITATTADGGFTKSYTLTVNEILMTNLSLENSSKTMSLGEKLVLIPTVDPINATDRSVTWISSDTSVATVTKDGVVVAIGIGTATITVRSVTDTALYAEFVVTVDTKLTGIHVHFDTDRGTINARLNGSDFISGGETSSTDILVLKYEEEKNYEFIEWRVSHGGKTDYYYQYSLRLTGITDDTVIVAHSRYYSLSVSLAGIIDVGTPTINDDLQLNWVFGTGIADPTVMSWEGGASTPLIVGDYMYVRVLDKIHKVDLSTGLSVADCPTVSRAAFFHFLDYSHGLIFDGWTQKIYDTDLNFVMDFSTAMEFPAATVFPIGEYTFTTFGKYEGGGWQTHLAKYTADLSQKLWEANIDGIYYPFQRIQLLYFDDYIYWLSTDNNQGYAGDLRMFNSVDAATGTIRNTVTLTEIEGYLLDDGWLTTDGTRLYITGYTSGLFVDDGVLNSKVAYATINNGRFSDVGYIDLGVPTQATSQFLVFNGRGYVFAGGLFNVYDVVDNGFELAYSAKISNRTHGGVVMDTSLADANGGEIYIYLLPYSGSNNLYIYSDHPGQMAVKERGYHIWSWGDYCSQAVRAGPNGELIWYTDSGLVYSVSVGTGLDKNYSFFVKNGNEGTWVTATGSDPKDALTSVGSGLGITWVADVPILNGNGLYLYYWKEQNSRWEPATSEMDYVRFNVWAISDRRPVADQIWYCADGNSFLGYTILEMAPAGILSGTEFTSTAPSVSVIDITLSEEALYLLKNERTQLTAEINPAIGAESRVVWSSGNTQVATVDQNGNIRAVGKGWTSITAYSYSEPSVSAVCYVTVAETAADVAVIGLTIDNAMFYMYVDGTNKINAAISPNDATDKMVTFVSSDPDVATVDSDGNIVAVGVGTAVITVKSVWNPFYKAECVVDVYRYQTPVANISLDKSEMPLDVGGTGKITATVLPSGASNKDVVWSSSNNSIAVVDTNGNVIAVSAGTAIITATTVDGNFTKVCLVTVSGDDTGGGTGVTTDVIRVSQTSLTMKVSDISSLTTYLSSGSMTGKTVRWVSSNTTVATVTSSGSVTAMEAGTAVITASLIASNGTTVLSTAVCVVTVEADASTGNNNSAEPPVQTEVSNGVNGQMSETTVKASVTGSNARVSQDNVNAILEQISDAKVSSKSSSLPAKVTVDAGSARTLSIPSPSSIANAGAGLSIVSSNGSMDIPNAVLKSMVSGKTGDLTVSINTVDKNELMKDHRDKLGMNDVVFEITAYVGSSAVHNLGGNVTVSMPFVIPNGTSIDDFHVWYLKDDGTLEKIDFAYKNGCILIVTDHLSYFSVGYKESSGGFAMDSMTVIILLVIAVFGLGVALAFMVGGSYQRRMERS